MRATAGYLVGVLVLLLVGAVCLAVGLLDREMVRARQQVVAEEYREPHKIFEKAEGYFEQASRVPWIGNHALNDIRARDAALHYWQRQYGALISEATDPVANIPADNVDLQFLVANSVYRDGAARAKDRATTIAALDAGISAYFTVLKNAARHDDASYNYEYLLRLRDEVEKGRRKSAPPPSGLEDQNGQAGVPLAREDMDKFKLYVPLNQEEIEKNNKAAAGKADPIKRKG